MLTRIGDDPLWATLRASYTDNRRADSGGLGRPIVILAGSEDRW